MAFGTARSEYANASLLEPQMTKFGWKTKYLFINSNAGLFCHTVS